jgi:hypothetical protein
LLFLVADMVAEGHGINIKTLEAVARRPFV